MDLKIVKKITTVLILSFFSTLANADDFDFSEFDASESEHLENLKEYAKGACLGPPDKYDPTCSGVMTALYMTEKLNSLLNQNSTVNLEYNVNQEMACKTTSIVCSGKTESGNTNWQPYIGGATGSYAGGDKGIYLDVDTSSCGLNFTPNYMTSITGSTTHWETTGATSIYKASPNGFRVYVRYDDLRPLTPSLANSRNFAINWVALSPTDCE